MIIDNKNQAYPTDFNTFLLTMTGTGIPSGLVSGKTLNNNAGSGGTSNVN